ncbi:hypothetical protein GGR50DRAFT_450258 [Xylaria sp. CBS 124048]|nr:hypothetical protein GGR50DRAFT_450258 [Xylaria sp. CBS 124048]
MLPLIDDNILKKNPRFEKLYNTLTTEILNADGSTKIDPSAERRDAVRQELKAYRLKAARVHLLRTAISTAVSDQASQPKQDEHQRVRGQQHGRSNSRAQSQSRPQTPALPSDLVQLLLLIPAFLNNASTLPPDSVACLLSSPPFTDLPLLFPRLIDVISARLIAQAKTLARVLSPTTNPSYIHRVIPTLPTITSTLITDVEETKPQELSRARLAVTYTLTRYLADHTEALTLLLNALEAKHGPVAKSSELRALAAATDAQTWATAAEALLWEMRQMVYPPDARAALVNYRQHLRDAGRRLEDGALVREVELADYGVAVDASSSASQDVRSHRRGRSRAADENKERTLREMARIWREMETRLREIQGDLHRLR